MHPTKTLTAVAVLIATVVAMSPAAAHEKGVLKPASRELPAGDSVALAGERFSHSATLHLVLVGPRGRLALGEVRTDSSGRFSARLALPAETVPGEYRLVAIAADGDEVAGVDVAVVPALARAEEPTVGPAEKPSAEPLTLERARSGLATGSAILFAAVAAISGIGLIRHRA